jgi:DNA invertase Pin-like site-specific DNA recombinase
MLYGYARVSTKGQARDGNSLEDQTKKLREAGAEEIYVDSFTGKRLDRPEFDKLKEKLQEGDTLIVTKLDRIARSATQGSELVQSFISDGIKVHVLNMGFMDNSPTGKLIMNVMFAFAEFERDMIIQRTSEGKEIARSRADFREGRPKVEVDIDTFKKLSQEQEDGTKTVKECCEVLNIAKTTWYKLRKEVIA